MNLSDKKIYIAGAGGMVGGAVKRNLEAKGCRNLIYKSSTELDLVNQSAVETFFAETKPEVVILSAAKVGGILANNVYRADFIYQNLMIEANVINAAFQNDVEKLIFLGSSCIYPKFAAQPIKEEELLAGFLEYTNEPYAVAKIAGIKLCESFFRQHDCNFLSVMPTNLYGSYDNFDLQKSHVIPALIRKFHEAKADESGTVVLWGSGTPFREFLYVEDLAEAVVFLTENVDARTIFDQSVSHVNIGTGEDITISELALLIKRIVGFKGEIKFDTSKPDGTPRKLLNVSRINELGWNARTTLEDGLKKTYQWFLENKADRS